MKATYTQELRFPTSMKKSAQLLSCAVSISCMSRLMRAVELPDDEGKTTKELRLVPDEVAPSNLQGQAGWPPGWDSSRCGY